MNGIPCVVVFKRSIGIMVESSIGGRSVIRDIGYTHKEKFASDTDFYNSKAIKEIDENAREELISMFKYSTPLHMDKPIIATPIEIANPEEVIKALIPDRYNGNYSGLYEIYSLEVKESD